MPIGFGGSVHQPPLFRVHADAQRLLADLFRWQPLASHAAVFLRSRSGHVQENVATNTRGDTMATPSSPEIFIDLSGHSDIICVGGLVVTTKSKAISPPSLTPLMALEQAAECLKTLAHPHRL